MVDFTQKFVEPFFLYISPFFPLSPFFFSFSPILLLKNWLSRGKTGGQKKRQLEAEERRKSGQNKGKKGNIVGEGEYENKFKGEKGI